MKVAIIVAMDDRGGIGLNNRLPWHLPADLGRFKRLTMGHHILMGRKTYESIGRQLPGRTMIVVTRQQGYACEGCVVVDSIAAGLQYALQNGEDMIFIIGGEQIFVQALPIADHLYLTRLHTSVEADAYFPRFDQNAWREVSRESHIPDGRNKYPYTFIEFHKKNNLS